LERKVISSCFLRFSCW